MSKSECISAKDCPATEHVTEEIAALRAALEQERDRRHLLVQLREQERRHRQATRHAEEVAALRAALEQERDRRHLLVQIREQEGKELEAKLDALRTKCICAKDCPATEHEYPPIEVDETLRELFAKAKTIRGKVIQTINQQLTTDHAYQIGYERGTADLLKLAIDCLTDLHAEAKDNFEHISNDNAYHAACQRVDMVLATATKQLIQAATI